MGAHDFSGRSALSATSPRWRKTQAWGLAAGLLVCAFIGYGSVLAAPFYLDDYHDIVDNPWIRWDGLRLDLLARTAFDGATARPVVYLSFALDHWRAGLDPAAFRVVNVALLALAGWLLAVLVRALGPRLAPRADDRERLLLAALAGALFVAHPLQIQAVTYIVQRMALLSTMFYLAALVAWVRAREAGSPAARWRNGIACALAWGLALGSKEIAITLPAAIWLIEWFFYRDLDAAFARRSALRLGVPVLLIGAIAYGIVMNDGAWGYAGRSFTAGERLLTEMRVVVHYLSLVVAPLPSRFNFLYDLPLSRSLLDPASTALSALALLALAGLAVATARRAPLFAFGVAWLFLQLALESAILPLALVFEHRMMLPMAGIAIAAAWAVLAAARGRAAPAIALGLCLVAALLVATRARNAVWADELRLWRDVAGKSPGLVAAQNNLAMAAARAGFPEESRAALERALRIDPGDAEALNNLGVQALDRGEVDAAIAAFQRALERVPRHARALHNLGRALSVRGDDEAALGYLEAARDVEPQAAPVWNGLGAVHVRLGHLAEALEAFRVARRLDPANPELRSNLRVVLGRRGVELAQAARFEQAVVLFEEARRLDAADVFVANELVWLLATAPEGRGRDVEGALALARGLVARTAGRDLDVLDAQAAAFASAGRFAEAVEVAEAVLAATPAEGPERARREARLRAYRDGRVAGRDADAGA